MKPRVAAGGEAAAAGGGGGGTLEELGAACDRVAPRDPAAAAAVGVAFAKVPLWGAGPTMTRTITTTATTGRGWRRATASTRRGSRPSTCSCGYSWTRTWTGWCPSRSSPRRRCRPSSSRATASSPSSRSEPASASAHTSSPAGARASTAPSSPARRRPTSRRRSPRRSWRQRARVRAATRPSGCASRASCRYGRRSSFSSSSSSSQSHATGLPAPLLPPTGPTDLSVKRPVNGDAGVPEGGSAAGQLSPVEVSAVRQLIAGYRESAAFLLRSADELENLILQQN
ncbi:unnamed protein product [Lampetra fluviatilis]